MQQNRAFHIRSCSRFISVLEYASPVWAGLPVYLSESIESVQKRALRIIFPGMSYKCALDAASLSTLSLRRDQTCKKFISKANASEPLRSVLSRNQINRPYNLRSGSTIAAQITPRTKRFTDFVTIRYQDSV